MKDVGASGTSGTMPLPETINIKEFHDAMELFYKEEKKVKHLRDGIISAICAIKEQGDENSAVIILEAL